MTQNRRNVALKLPTISLNKGYFGQFKGYTICLGIVGAQLEGFLLPRVESRNTDFTLVLI